MIRYLQIVCLCILLIGCGQGTEKAKTITAQEPKVNNNMSDYALVIHGGAGSITKERMSPEKEKERKAALVEALTIGKEILAAGGSSTDAVVAVVVNLEDCPFFNAGKGSVFTYDGSNEMDASIMIGKDRKAGAVGGVKTIKNPIKAARAVMDKSKHVMMVGQGAETFASMMGLEIVSPKYFFTQPRYETLKRVQEAEKAAKLANPDNKYGTVGCVALDKHGVITAGTSTGGMTNKRYNRVGDSPIIGAGTYADDFCGISCTGHGEYFIRYTVARDIAARVEYKGMSLPEASNFVINDLLVDVGGDGGIIGLDKKGNIVMPFNTNGMYRGYANSKELVVKMYKD